MCVCRWESALRNLSALLQLGNSAEVRNYISVLSHTLNRLSSDPGRNARAQRHARNAFICTVCRLASGEQAGGVAAKCRDLFYCRCITRHLVLQEPAQDSICILRNLFQVPNEVGLWVAFTEFTKEGKLLKDISPQVSIQEDANVQQDPHLFVFFPV